MNEFKYNIGYALSGGFIKGFAHLGIMQALHEHGIKPEILSGVSAGALAAVFYADGKEPFHIVELFEHHSFKELTTFSINKQGLLKLDSFIDFLNSNLVENDRRTKNPHYYYRHRFGSRTHRFF